MSISIRAIYASVADWRKSGKEADRSEMQALGRQAK
jgi:hypothetical protein